jgi:hypothetical protein
MQQNQGEALADSLIIILSGVAFANRKLISPICIAGSLRYVMRLDPKMIT